MLANVANASDEVDSNATPAANVWMEPRHDSLYIVIPVTVIYALIFLSGVVGNVVTCIVISRNKHMHTATNYYLFSLAVSDLLLLVSGLPQEMYYIWSRYPYVFGELFCVVQGFAAETSANATVLTITAFTVERYVAICHPFLSHNLSKLSRALRLIVAIWLLALALAVPQAIQFGIVYGDEGAGFSQCTIKWILIDHAFEISTVVFFVAPMTLITVLYVLIGIKLRRSRLLTTAKRTSISSGTDRFGENSRSVASTQNYVIKMLVAVVVGFFICWAPFHAQRLLAIYGNAESHFTIAVYSSLTYVSGVLYYLSTSINPLLYHIMSHKFRGAFKATLTQLFGRGRKHRESCQRQNYSMLCRCQPPPGGQPPTRLHNGSSTRRHGSATGSGTGVGDQEPRPGSSRRNNSLPSDRPDFQLSLEGVRVPTVSEATTTGQRNSRTRQESAGERGGDLKTKTVVSAMSRNLIRTHLPNRKLQGRSYPVDPTPDAHSFPMFTGRKRGGSESSQITMSTSVGKLSLEGVRVPTVSEATTTGQRNSRTRQESAGESGSISNSSLQDMDGMEFCETELAQYMGELNRR